MANGGSGAVCLLPGIGNKRLAARAMEMHQVRYFLAVSRLLNFTRAAEECRVAQPSLTRAIKKLEQELGGELFRRERTRTHLTELGRQMLPHLQRCYDGAVAARAMAQALKRGKVAPLRLALSHSVDLRHFTPVLVELVRVLPGLALRLLRGSGAAVAAHLRKGEAEVAIAAALDDDWDRLERWPLFEAPFALMLHKGRPLARRNAVEPSDLAGEILLARPYCESHGEAVALLEEHGLAPAGHYVDCEEDVLALLEADLGIAILPRGSGDSPLLRAVPLRGLELKRTVHAYAVAGRQRSIAAATLLKLLRAKHCPAATQTSPDMTATVAA